MIEDALQTRRSGPGRWHRRLAPIAFVVKFTVAATLITALLSALVVGPPSLQAQQPSSIRRVGVLIPWRDSSPVDWNHSLLAAFRQRMRDLGYTDGRHVVFEGRRGPDERLPDLAAELVNLNVEVIVAWSTAGVAAAKRRTKAIPIVMATSGDAVGNGLVASLARPGGNVTGLSWQSTELVAKRVHFIRELVPGASRIGVLWDSTAGTARSFRAALEDTMRVTKLHVELVEALTPADLDKAFEALRRARVDGVAIMPAPRYFNQPHEVASAALAHRLVTVFAEPEAVRAGGLMAYTVDFVDMARQAANYVDRILRGAKPADLPVEQPTKFEFVINMKTARALGLTIPQSLLLQADKIFE